MINGLPVTLYNKSTIGDLIKNINVQITDYIDRYVKCLNIDLELNKFIDSKLIPYSDNIRENDPEYFKLKNDKMSQEMYVARLVKEYYKKIEPKIMEKAKELQNNLKHTSTRKRVKASTNSIYDLKICMEEYREKGLYSVRDINDIDDYFKVICRILDLYEGLSPYELYGKDANSIKDFRQYVEEFLSKETPLETSVLVSSIHQMKGGEGDNIFIYDYPKMPYSWKDITPEQAEQELNLKYVAITRAKQSLGLCLLNEYADNPKINESNKNLNKACIEDIKKLYGYMLQDLDEGYSYTLEY